VARHAGGWLLREAGMAGVAGFGVPVPNPELTRRLKDAFDPERRLAPGRIPLDPAEPAEPAAAGTGTGA
jgi:FAD/FMN-containing dehydrogenase